MDADRDYYQGLLVVPDAPGAMIEVSYRTLKQRLRAKRSVAAEALLDEAYRVLSDPEQRAAYDLERDVALSERQAADFAATAVLDRDAARYAAHRCLFCGTELDHALKRDDDCRECGSPLYPSERHRLEYSGQRMLRRIPSRREIDL
jgi:curved DNA-binding protein CbpA